MKDLGYLRIGPIIPVTQVPCSSCDLGPFKTLIVVVSRSDHSVLLSNGGVLIAIALFGAVCGLLCLSQVLVHLLLLGFSSVWTKLSLW